MILCLHVMNYCLIFKCLVLCSYKGLYFLCQLPYKLSYACYTTSLEVKLIHLQRHNSNEMEKRELHRFSGRVGVELWAQEA